jgi:hypothetical protein
MLMSLLNGKRSGKLPLAPKFKPRIPVAPKNHFCSSRLFLTFDRQTFQYDVTLVAESARWAGSFNDSPNNGAWNIDNWLTDFTNSKNNFITGRNLIVKNAYQAAFPTMFSQNIANVPTFSLADNATVTPGTNLVINSPASCQLFYTKDGTDPRVPITGNTAAGAVAVGSNTVTIPLTTSTKIRARCKIGTTWNTLDEVYIRVNQPCNLCGKIIISEIFYRPRDPAGSQPKMVHFVEIQNIGSTTLDLTGCYLKPVQFVFPPVLLAPGAFYVASRSYEEFKNVYGRFSDGYVFGSPISPKMFSNAISPLSPVPVLFFAPSSLPRPAPFPFQVFF